MFLASIALALATFVSTPTGGVAAPFQSEPLRPLVVDDDGLVTVSPNAVGVQFPTGDAPAGAVRLVGMAAMAALLLRFLIGLLKTPMLGGVWMRLGGPWKLIVMALLTASTAAFDAIAAGTPWFTAISAAVIGMFTASASFEYQKEALGKRG